MFFLRSFPAGLSTRSLLATATATATRPLASSLAIRQRSDMPAGSSTGGSPPGNKQASAAAAPVDRAQSVSDFSQDSANKPDYVALVAAKEDRMKKAVQLWNEGQLCNQIAGSLGTEKPLAISTIRGYLLEMAKHDKDFAESLTENWERFTWEEGVYKTSKSLEAALEQRERFRENNARGGYVPSFNTRRPYNARYLKKDS